MHITCIILDAISQVNKMQDQHLPEPSVGRVPLPLLPSYLQPATNKPVQTDFFAKTL